MAAYTELYMDQGTTFNNTLNLFDDVTNTPLYISGYTVTAQMRRSYYSQKVTANLTCTITNVNTGEITVSLTPAQTSAIKAGRYVFDVKTKSPENVVTRVLEGIINVTPQVTK